MSGETAKKIVEQGGRLKSLGKYKLIAALAEGGMAKVYLGLMAGPAGFNKLLVIKVMNRDDESLGEDAVQQFWDEARLAARVIHSNIVHTYEVGEQDGHFFLAMEYLDGQSYRTLQARLPDERVPLPEQLRILSEVARGLHYAHELKGFKGEPLGVVHRDVSPQNVFITYDGQVKLLDFGIAKTYDSGHKTKVGVIKGKLDYIAPEQLSGDNVDARADIFALGAMLWEAVSGKRFSGGRKVAEVTKIHARLTGGEHKIRAVVPDVPEQLANIIDRAIAVNPAQRWQSAGAFADALDAYIESTGTRPATKSLSEAMTAIFAEERQRMHKLVDQQIEAMRVETDLTGSLPNFSLSTTSTITPSSVRDQEERGTASTRRDQVPAAKAGLRGASLAVGILAAAAVAWVVMRQEPEPHAGASALNQQQPATAPVIQQATPAEPTVKDPKPTEPTTQELHANTVTIRITAVPRGARVTLDGAELPSPFTGKFRRGSELHQLEVTAKGYQAHKSLLDFSRDQSIDVVLAQAPQGRGRGGSSRNEPANTPAVTAPAPAPQAPAPEPPPARKPAPGTDLEVRPRAPSAIDTFNPYKK